MTKTEKQTYMKKYNKKYYARTKAKKLEYMKKWRIEHKDLNRSRAQEWNENNKARLSANSAKSKAAKFNAVPTWFSNEHQIIIIAYYEKAKELSTSDVQYHVDHIVPLNGEFVSGLHVPWNLQVITAKENLEKSNKHG